MGAHFERARILYRQMRFDLAERELREQLRETPDDGCTHAFLGWCLAKQNRMTEAVKEGEEAVRLAPALAYCHYSLGYIYLSCDRLEEGETALREALRLAPRDAEYLEWLSWAKHRRGDTRAALKTVNRGLEIDPEHVGCLSRRGYYLRWLGEWQRSEKTLRACLRLDPENAYTHTNLGWTLWSKAHAKARNDVIFVACRPELGEALEHFREGLRLSPDWDWPRTGAMSILLLRRKVIFRVAIGIFALIAIVALLAGWERPPPGQSVNRRGQTSEPLDRPIGVVLIAGAAVTAGLAQGPLYALLRWSRLGDALLTPGQRQAARLATLCLSVAAAATVAAMLTPPPWACGLVFVASALIGPITVACEAAPGRTQTFLVWYTVGLAALALIGLAVIFLGDPRVVVMPGFIVLLVVVAGSWQSAAVGKWVEKRFGGKAG